VIAPTVLAWRTTVRHSYSCQERPGRWLNPPLDVNILRPADMAVARSRCHDLGSGGVFAWLTRRAATKDHAIGYDLPPWEQSLILRPLRIAIVGTSRGARGGIQAHDFVPGPAGVVRLPYQLSRDQPSPLTATIFTSGCSPHAPRLPIALIWHGPEKGNPFGGSGLRARTFPWVTVDRDHGDGGDPVAISVSPAGAGPCKATDWVLFAVPARGGGIASLQLMDHRRAQPIREITWHGTDARVEVRSQQLGHHFVPTRCSSCAELFAGMPQFNQSPVKRGERAALPWGGGIVTSRARPINELTCACALSLKIGMIRALAQTAQCRMKAMRSSRSTWARRSKASSPGSVSERPGVGVPPRPADPTRRSSICWCRGRPAICRISLAQFVIVLQRRMNPAAARGENDRGRLDSGH